MKITVFTPTYNRANKLMRVYQSLLSQRIFNFEWLIIDDGSTDETENVVAVFLKNKKFSVRYKKKGNGGKHTAYNTALLLAKGEYFMCLDSDDYLAPDAMENVAICLTACRPDEGIIAYKAMKDGERLSQNFPLNISYASTSELSLVYQCKGEFSLIYPTFIARKYPFPVFENEKFVTECVVYDKIAEGSRMRLLSKVLTLGEFQIDGYTSNLNQMMKDNPSGYCQYFMQRIDMQPKIKDQLIYAGKFYCFRLFSGNKKIVYIGRHRYMKMLAIPLGGLFWIYYKIYREF